ncbi:MAG: SEC-C domain-containing protein [Kurthia sp.]|nr:SEC-C domain-containing protein [Candidatus Kurthia equi]
MIGRNDPCPCGSGKKYKKCCATKEVITVVEVLDEELERTLQTFYDVYPQRKDYESYHTVVSKWNEALGHKISLDLIEAIAMDYFFFHERLDIWQGYLEKTIKQTIRPATKEALGYWSAPKMLMAKVVSVDETWMTVETIYSKEMLRLRREGDRPIPENVHVFCFMLPEVTMLNENAYMSVSSMIFFPTDHHDVFSKFIKTVDQKANTEEDFWKANAIELWKALAEHGFEGNEFTDFETEVINKIMNYLEEQQRSSEKIIPLVEDFIVEEQPKARKPVAIAAGAIRFGNDNGYFEHIDTTVKAIADAFGISASSMNKYEHELALYVEKKNK